MRMNANLIIPPQKEMMDFPKSHQVMKRDEIKPIRFFRNRMDMMQAIVIQQPRIIARTGNNKKIRFPLIIKNVSSNPQAYAMK
jgi:hypothetical protein